jgi:hypothetical protein
MQQSSLRSPKAVLEINNHRRLSSRSWALKSEILPTRRLYRQPVLSISIAKSFLVLQGKSLHVKRLKKMHRNHSKAKVNPGQ